MQTPSAGTAPSWTSIPTNWTTVQFAGALPDVIYRYRQIRADSLETKILSEIIEETVFLAGMGELNDPDEGRIRWVFDGSEEDIYQFWKRALREQNSDATRNDIRKEARERTASIMREQRVVRPSIINEFNSLIDNLARVACFTANSLNNAMWSHYGKWVKDSGGGFIEHGGICIEYECGEARRTLGFGPVSYSQDRPTVNILASQHERALQTVKGLFVKDPSWSYEDEWRMVAFIQAQPPFPQNLTQHSKLRFEGSVRAVIFGLNTTDKTIQDVESILKAHHCQVPLQRVYRHPSTQKLDIRPV